MSRPQAVSLMILVTLLWSIAGVVTRHLDSAPSFEVTFWRSTFNAIALAIGLTLIRGVSLWKNILHSPRIIWISGICWAIMYTSFMVALTLTTVANVLIVMALGPLITALFARIFLQHKLPTTTWLAIAIAALGIIWMFLYGEDATFSIIGSLISLGVPLSAAINFTILQHVSLNREPQTATSAKKAPQDMLPAVLIGATLSALATLPLAWPFQASVHDLGLLSILGVFQLAIPCLLVVRLTKELSAPELSLLGQLEVIFGVTWAWLWAGEHLSSNTLTGGAMVLGALTANELFLIFNQRRARKKIL
ncbi:MAG: EamA family transporter [Desulfocapsa sp.]|nr:EamA family transporter [Desulfocapsa sp.]